MEESRLNKIFIIIIIIIRLKNGDTLVHSLGEKSYPSFTDYGF